MLYLAWWFTTTATAATFPFSHYRRFLNLCSPNTQVFGCVFYNKLFILKTNKMTIILYVFFYILMMIFNCLTRDFSFKKPIPILWELRSFLSIWLNMCDFVT